MAAQPVARLSLLMVATLALAGCTLFGGGQETPTPTPTLITPQAPQATTPPPSDTPTLTPTPTVEITPTPTPTATPEEATSHQVVGGQWVYAIARLYGIDPSAIIAANPNIQGNPDLIFPDQQLVIPRTAAPTAVPSESPTPTATNVPNPTAGAPSLPVTDRAVYEALLAESLPAVDPSTCSTAVSSGLSAAWGQATIGPRLGCASAEATAITGSWIEFGPGSRIIWLRERGEFHTITGSGFGQRWVYADNSGVAADAPLLVRPDGSTAAYTPATGRYAWLLTTYPEIKGIFSPAYGDENVVSGEYQAFENGALLFDGALTLAFFDDSGPWWTLVE